MRSGCISDFIDCFHCRIYSCIKTDGIICTGNIKIDGSRNTYCVYPKVRKLLRSCERTVSADNNQTIDTIFLTDSGSFLLSFLCTHGLAACRLKNRTSTLNCIGYVAGRQVNDLLLQKAVIASADSADF